jgi:hypothetical protein
MKTRLLATLVLISSGDVFAKEADAKTPIDPTVSRVESGGAWEDRSQRGHYRAVTYTRCSREHCYDTLAVEWIATDSGGMKVVSTKMVSEVGDLTSITEVRFVISRRDTRLQIKHEANTEDRWTRCLTLGVPGTYLVKKGVCGKAG